MSRPALLSIVLACAAGSVAAPDWAAAQCRLCDTPTTMPDGGSAEAPVSLEIETSLDFDRLVLLGAGEGSAVLRPDGSRIATGSIAAISGRAMVGSAVVRGEPGRSVRVDLPRAIELHSLGGSRITIDDIVSDLPSAPRLDSAGALHFRFGGRLRIVGEPDGDHRGEVQITVEYL